MFDIDLLSTIRALIDVQRICTNKRIYHEQVLSSNPNSLNYPCMVYQITFDEPDNELSGTSGLRHAQFTFDSYSTETNDIRDLKSALDSISQTFFLSLTWVTVRDSTDQFDPPIDTDERGLKFAQTTIDVWYTSASTSTTTAGP